MGYRFTEDGMKNVWEEWKKEYVLYAPLRMGGGNTFSDVDCIRYGVAESVGDVVFDRKSEYSFKEALLPLSETLFFFTEDQVKEADPPKKGAIVFLRSCDLHAVKRLDEIYLQNGCEDYYYKRLRERIRFVLMGCQRAFDSCFCVDMGTNRCDWYDAGIQQEDGCYLVDNRQSDWEELLKQNSWEAWDGKPSYVTETKTRVSVPAELSIKVADSHMWDEYDQRCISCGRCNFVCPTCTCFTMQDFYYTDNGKSGERRRVQASCMVDGFTDTAGGGSYRKKNGERMRFKVMHKMLDFKERFGYPMCVGCGRCDDTCPEYISYSDCVNRLAEGMKEVTGHAE